MFVDDYKRRRLDDETDKLAGAKSLTAGDAAAERQAGRDEKDEASRISCASICAGCGRIATRSRSCSSSRSSVRGSR